MWPKSICKRIETVVIDNPRFKIYLAVDSKIRCQIYDSTAFQDIDTDGEIEDEIRNAMWTMIHTSIRF